MDEEPEEFLILDDDDETPVSQKPEETPVLPSMPKLPSLKMPGFLRSKTSKKPEPKPEPTIEAVAESAAGVLDADLAAGMMSINAVKGVEIGRGFENTRRLGHDIQDIVVPDPEDLRRFSRTSNEAGGIEGGMSNGEPIVTYVAIKPIATMTRPLPSVDVNTGEIIEAPYHRSDVCQVPPACVVGEAMMALVLAHAMLEKFGGDHLREVQRNVAGYIESHREFGTSI